MKKSIIILTVLIGFSAFVFNSCSKSSDNSATPAAVSPAAGKWGMNNGSVLFTLSLNTDNTYGLLASGANLESGTYTWADTSVTFNASGGTSNCKGPGKYTYKIVGSALTFKLFSDSCSLRIAATVGTWYKQ